MINRIKDGKRKKKVRLTFKSSLKRGCTYESTTSQVNIHDNSGSEEIVNSNGQLSRSLPCQAAKGGENGNLISMYIS